LDESGAKTTMTRLYGRAPRHQRVGEAAPAGRWQTTTMIAVVGRNGPQAPFIFDGPIDGEVFRTYVTEVLAPSLKKGDVLVMDNLSTHKDRLARGAILATGAQILDLPPYSPDFNPIEAMWSKIKAFLRKQKARTPEALWDTIADALKTISQNDIQGWFRKCGYSLI
jgi:transposase